MGERQELLEVLREAKSLLALPSNNFCWPSWEDTEAALREIDDLIIKIESGTLPERREMSVLFAPTGPIQEVSLSSGWADEFLDLATRFDQIEQQIYQ